MEASENNQSQQPIHSEVASFGICPFCGYPLSWGSDGCMYDMTEEEKDLDVLIHYLHCSNCGADIEAIQCPIEERHNYMYWQDDDALVNSTEVSIEDMNKLDI